MRRLLAIGVRDSWVSDWQLFQGNEMAVVAAPIGEGERVWLEVESHDSVETIPLSPTPAPLGLDRPSRYRVVKDCGGVTGVTETSVEVILSNGSKPA